MKRPIDKDFSTIREYMVAMEDYVKFLEGEVDGIDDKLDEITIEPIYFKGAIVEDEQASFEAVVLTEGDDVLNDTLTITYVDKRVEMSKRKEEYWESYEFFIMTLQGNKVTGLSLSSNYLFRDFLKELNSLEWF